jgi:hypothetical protein
LFGRKTLKEIASALDISFPTLQKALTLLSLAENMAIFAEL